jgi:Tfp pilus assembly protein PilO
MKIRQIPTYLLASGLMGLVILGLLVAIVFQQIASSGLSSDIRHEREAIDMYKKDATAYKQITTDYSYMSAKLGGKYKDVSWTTRMPFVVSDLSGMTQARHLKIETLKPEPVTAADGVYRLPMRITLKAQIGDLARLAQDIETSVPYMDIERMDVHMPSDKSESLQCDMTISSFAVQDDDASQPMTGVGSEKPVKKISAKKNSTGDQSGRHRGAL